MVNFKEFTKKKSGIERIIGSMIKGFLFNNVGGRSNGYETFLSAKFHKFDTSFYKSEIQEIYTPSFRDEKDTEKLAGYVRYLYQGGIEQDIFTLANELIKKEFGEDALSLSYTIKVKYYSVGDGCFTHYVEITF